MNKFDTKHNYDDVFFRDVTLGLMKMFHGKVKWENRGESGIRNITIPFQYSYVGEERYLLDLFVDDTAGTRLEGNVDKYPRGFVMLSASNIKTSEITNPDTPILCYKEDADGMLKKIYVPYRMLPMKFTFEVSILMRTEIDQMKCQQAIINALSFYTHYYIDHTGIRLECTCTVPEGLNTERPSEISPTSADTKKSVKFSVDVHTHYPVPPVAAEAVPTNRTLNKIKGQIKTLGNKGTEPVMLGMDALKKARKSPKF